MSDEEIEELLEEEDIDEETKTLVEDYGLDTDTAERAKELIDEGLGEDEAVELAEDGV